MISNTLDIGLLHICVSIAFSIYKLGGGGVSEFVFLPFEFASLSVCFPLAFSEYYCGDTFKRPVSSRSNVYKIMNFPLSTLLPLGAYFPAQIKVVPPTSAIHPLLP